MSGQGLGLRQPLFSALEAELPDCIDFFEVAPENWLNRGGLWQQRFEQIIDQRPLYCHGLSLSLGGLQPFDPSFLTDIRNFIDLYDVCCYSEHLSYSNCDGYLYDLLPLPFLEEAVHHVSQRIMQVQNVFGRRIAVENISYYCATPTDMCEIDFINAVLNEADCELLLDINNVQVYVNRCALQC